jgi:subtilase family serine protease
MSRILRSGRVACAMLAIVSATLAFSATAGSRSAHSLVTQKIDNNNRVTLAHNVRPELNAKTDLGPVEDTLPIARMFLVLKRTTEQQATLNTLIEHQHQSTAAEYHQWLTPKAFGEKFGASQADVAAVTDWLTSQGFTVNYVTHGNTMVDFSGTSRMVRESFHTQLHYVDVSGEKRIANAQDPQIPAALAPIVAGIVNLENIPPHADHTPIHGVVFDKETHKWHDAPGSNSIGAPHALDNGGGGYYLVSPQDFYTIYNENPLLLAGHTGASATVAVIEQSAIAYGTVNGTTGQATGGDIALFRGTFGVPGTLNMYVYNGYGKTTCATPPIIGDEGEATIDAEWATAVAPNAKLIFMECASDNTLQGGIFASMTALIDNNLSDTMSLSYGGSELGFMASDYTFFDTLVSQAATQGQSIFISSGDSGSDVADQNTSGTATSGINVSGFSDSPYVTASGGTDFQDGYDASEGGPAQSVYWGATNTSFYGDALSYVPETAWNDSCASSILAELISSDAPVAFCNSATASGDGLVAGDVVGGSGGFSTHYAAPSYQTGITGFSGTQRAQPDVSLFAANGVLGHYLVFCDTTDGYTCTGNSTFAGAGGTSFVAPQLAGLGALLKDYTGSRQGVLNYALYALAKAQFTNSATKTACYANGQTSNTGVTTGLPATSCIFNDVTTSNNDVPCASGSLNCYTGGSAYGILSTTSGTLSDAFDAGIGYDEVAGIGSININNLLTKWNSAFTSTTALTASPATITTSQSTTLTAMVTGGTPAGYTGKAPTLSGSVNFFSGTTKVGSCSLSAGACNVSVSGSTLGVGSDTITATFVGSNAYPTSTSTAVTVTVNAPAVSTTTAVTAAPTSAIQGQPITLTATVTSSGGTPTGMVTFTNAMTSLGTCTLSAGTCSATTTALAVGTDIVTAAYGGDTGFNASNATVTVTITAGTPTITANPTTVAIASPGASGTTTLTVYGFSSSSYTFACTGLPSGATCSAGAVSGGKSTLTISTTAASVTGKRVAANTNHRRGGSGPAMLAFCLPGFLALAGLAGVRRKSILSRTLFIVALSFGLAAGITGCGSSGNSNPGTPTGSSTVTITATAGSQSAMTNITLTVN